MSKSEALKYAMTIGFGLAAGIHLYVVWASLIELAWWAVIRVPMPVVVPADIIQGINVKGAFAMGIERYGDEMLKLAKKE